VSDAGKKGDVMAIPDEQMAFKIVQLYVEEVSQRGEKRQMGLDTIINAYFYTLLRLKKKRQEMGMMEPAVEKEEAELAEGVEELSFESGKPSDQFEFE
jgi:hypothetical protein